PTNGALRSARADRRVVHDLRYSRNALDRGRMRAEDDGTARFERNQNFVDRRGGRVGRRHHGRDDAEWLGDFNHALVFVARDDADRLHALDEGVDLLRTEQVFLNFVGDDAVAGFIY